MPLNPGTRLGSYEIIAPIGAGGMGEVYRARDARLGRDVAIKVLPAMLASDPDALARFEREMKTLAALSHPHIVVIYDVGREGTTAYAVTELLEGESLAAVAARGPVPVRKGLDYGIQIARALAAAHERGIVHRDLKPDNVFVTTGGHLKVLDFGLARTALPATAADDSRTVAAGTTPGMVMGTVGYMAPEQARGLTADHRADIFAFGCVMYELVAGRRAFQRDSAADTLSAILKEDPPPLSGISALIPPALDRVIHRCLEKDPAERFQSARDVAFALDALSTGSAAGSGPVAAARTPRWRPVAAVAGIVAALGAAFVIGRQLARPDAAEPIVMKPLTTGRGVVRTARFAPDGQTIVYGAAWDDAPLRMFLLRSDTAESKPLDLAAGDIHAISKNGDLLVSLGRRYTSSWTGDGTLARGRLFGSSAREVLERVRDADLLPDGGLVIVRRVDGRDRLEVPQGKVVFETPGYIDRVRVSPDGGRVAFMEHPLYGDNRGHVALYDGTGVRRLTPEYGAAEGLAWSADGREIWFTGAQNEPHWMLMAVDAAAAEPHPGRVLWYVPRDLIVQDIDASGRVLLTGNTVSGTVAGAAPGESRDRLLNASAWMLPGHISRDGKVTVATTIDTDDVDYSVMLRPMDGGAAVRIGSGRAQEVSPDGKWALSITPTQPQRVLLLPTGAGESRQIEIGDLSPNLAVFVPGANLVVAVVGVRGGVPMAILADVTSGKRTDLDLSALRGRAFGRRRFIPSFVSPDGALLAIGADDGKVLAWKLPAGGEPREIAALADNEVFVGWSANPSRIYVAAWTGPKARVDALDLGTSRRTFVREIAIADPAGMLTTPDLYLSADASAHVYGFSRMISTLYVVTGLR